MNSLLYGFIALQLFIVAWIDLKSKVISNYWHFLNIFSGIILYIFMTEIFLLTWNLLLFPVGFILVGFLLFWVGIMGAGDSKYLASLYLIIPPDKHFPFFESLLVCTIAAGAFLLSYRTIKNFKTLRAYVWSRHWQGIKEVIKSEFSYAPVIFLAWLSLGAKLWV
jgi:prepilin peptidase CpaA